jgi:hypothetical protein
MMAACVSSWAQENPPAPPPNEQKDQSTPGSNDKSAGEQKPPDQQDSKGDADKDKNEGQPDQPARPSVVDTMNSTMTSTVETVRRLPAQWFLGTYVPANQDLKPLTLVERRDVYLRQTYLTGASYLKRLFSAGVDQARGAPYEWGGGMGGYGKRFASRYGQFIIQNSISAAGDAILGYEPRYDYCKCTGFWPRTKHAIARNFYTYNFTESEKRLQIPLYVGAFGAGAISAAAWRPASDVPWKDGTWSVASQAGFGILSNWLQEFALDIGHKLTPRRHRNAAPGSGFAGSPGSSD